MSSDEGRTFSTPTRVSEDRWAIAGCPDDGPSMAVDASARVHIVWPTMVTEGGVALKAVFYATTIDGLTFSPRVRLSEGAAAYHPRVLALPGGELLVAWDEASDGATRVRVARTTAGASPTWTVEAPRDDLVGRYPALAVAEGRALMAWVSGTGQTARIRVRRF